MYTKLYLYSSVVSILKNKTGAALLRATLISFIHVNEFYRFLVAGYLT